MAGQDNSRKPHFLLTDNAFSDPYRSPPAGGGDDNKIPDRDRKQHGNALLNQLQTLQPTLSEARKEQEEAGIEEGFGLQVEFESFPDIELAFESLARERSGIELLNVRHDEHQTLATIFIPDGKLDILEKLVHTYLDESKDKNRVPKHSRLLNAIAQIRSATLEALWTDTPEALPKSDEETLWWEVWLPTKKDRAGVIRQFKELAKELGFIIAQGEVIFPERSVLMVHGSAEQMKRSLLTLNTIAELRRAKETAEFFDAMAPQEQPDWLEELLARTHFPETDEHVPHVCLFDTGVTRGHPFLAPALSPTDLHTVEPGWGVDDNDGHGTSMAGLALAGDWTPWLASQEPLNIGHRLESVKLLPHGSSNGQDARHHGYLTSEAVFRPEILAPERARVFSMTVTARDNRDRGRPSAWSATIDRLAADADSQAETPRLFILSAGNVSDPNAWSEYPSSNASDSIHDPGQAWNALTVGAATELVHITEPDTNDYQPIAPLGGLSPFSTTSLTWQAHWPLKPDIVFEGGNAAMDSFGAAWMTSLSLLTANASPTERLFTTANATSAATSLAARMAAQLMAEYPHLWPESVRALIVHSAEWSNAMRDMFLPATGRPSKKDIAGLIRHCGFGIPNLEQAMWSFNNSLTLVCQEMLRPFKKDKGKDTGMREMHLHELPWPLDELEALGEAEVEMRVTLSYFIEPNPSARGFSSRYRYQSHGLRFDVRRPHESVDDFRARINAAARDEEESIPTGGQDNNWLIGKQNRHKGSLHSDIWRGSAADLASRGIIGIYPAMGWWRTRPKLERYDSQARYALIVSIKAPDVDVDLYTAVANKVATPTMVNT
ncbi:S8 family peptidase [Chromohalobacter sp. HP20-39]|uniref:S8 family peptidase n=1 Tax=Chromohalobacter sp. HP20-39 TaxID=3079306 RepID=UPI00294AC7CC|nr:S8 family peptidase [Chromohalobacter sp. HP20-39]MDV6317836.1 S8 family peptidase [Chromohalobacter sp. HP20-39]